MIIYTTLITNIFAISPTIMSSGTDDFLASKVQVYTTCGTVCKGSGYRL